MKWDFRDKMERVSRREALRIGAGAIAGGALGFAPVVALGKETAGRAPVAVSGPGHVVKVHLPGMRKGSYPSQDAARRMVDAAVCTLAGESDIGRAWLKFISPTDRVGIKVNCLGTRMVSTMREVAFAIAGGIREAGVPDANIVIIDMFASNMMGGRYEQRTNRSKLRVLAHRESGYQKSFVHAGPARLKFSDLFLDTTAIINVPPIKDHDLAGVTCNMKNMTFGVVEKPHINHRIINEAIPYIWALDEIRSRVRLNIIDGSTVLFDGGPKYNPRALVAHECIYATTDPVAMDAYAAELIELLRAQNGLRTLAQVGRPPKYLKLAEQMGLGLASRDSLYLQSIELT